jgi:hypothetical protein
MSQLQLIGILGAILLLLIGGRALRNDRVESTYPAGLVLTAIVIGLIALFPGISGILNDLLAIGRFQGSRLIALLIVGLIITLVYLIVVSSRVWRLNRQFDRYLRGSVVNEFLHQDTANMEGAVLCVIPAYNEADNLGSILPRFPHDVDGVPVIVLVVNDGSTDATSSVVRNNDCLLVEVPANRGGGAALRTGFDIGVACGAQVVVTIDADGQNDPEAIPDLARPILNYSADVIIGSRILGEHEITRWWRHLGVVLFSHLINLLMGTRITDCSSGFRAIRTTSLGQLTLFQDQYHTSEFLIQAAKKGLRIDEKPIVFRRRISGKSKKGHEVLYAFRFFYVLTTTWLRRG